MDPGHTQSRGLLHAGAVLFLADRSARSRSAALTVKHGPDRPSTIAERVRAVKIAGAHDHQAQERESCTEVLLATCPDVAQQLLDKRPTVIELGCAQLSADVGQRLAELGQVRPRPKFDQHGLKRLARCWPRFAKVRRNSVRLCAYELPHIGNTGNARPNPAKRRTISG